MIVEEGLAALRRVPAGSVMSIGNFDGVHLGHARIIEKTRELASPGRERVVVTFEPHPLTVLRPELAPPRLTSPSMKRSLLASMGIDRLIVLPPSGDVLDTSAEAFYSILRDEAGVSHLVEGANFNFGKGRGGTIARLREWCERDAILLTTVDEVQVTLTDLAVVPVSSSLVRWLLAHGRVRDAAICLGRPFSIEGEVVRGEQRGRTIGFPTANIDCDLPLLAPGVYAARCQVDGHPYAVALSVGTKPTFHGDADVTVEGYFLDFTGDLYGRHLAVELLGWVRGQAKFPSLESLVEQMHRDVKQVAQETRS